MSGAVGLVRAVIAVTGSDSVSFLNRLLTVDVPESGGGVLGALLTPRGTIVCDLLMYRVGEGVILDVAESVAADLCGRLVSYRLRAAVEIALVEDRSVILGMEDGEFDPRHDDLPRRGFVARGSAVTSMSEGAYHRVRIGLMIPESVADYGSDSVYPADVNLDLLGGVDFSKGCFIGQEVVSRMKRRGRARRRTVLLHCSGPCPESGAGVMTGTTRLGEITSRCDSSALARLRIDRLAEAGVRTVQIGETTATIDLPDLAT